MTEATLLGGRYELGEQLGVGGMAEVYRGRDTRLGRDVAIKLLRTEFVNDPTFIARFRREAQSAAALNHPNIVSVYDTGDGSGVPFIVMEFVEGRTLREVLRAEGRMLPERALEITADICAALAYSHENGIVHRDIKPGNVMLTRTGQVKVMDFGIARAVTTHTMTQTAAVLGTAQYLSPEQARGEHVDARSDIYSTGCVLFELLTHTPPFTGDSPVSVAYQHVREDAPLPSSRVAGLDSAVDAVVLKALAKNPANRYQSAAEMREDLLRAAAGRPVAATPVLGPEDTVAMAPVAGTMVMEPAVAERRGRRWPAYLALALATILVFVLAAVVATNLVGNGDGDVRTPELVGLTEQQARDRLAEAGLEPGTVKQAHSPEPAGRVIAQDPVGGILLNRGDGVDFTVSLGVKMVKVPSLVDESLDDAQAKLEDAELKTGRVIEIDTHLKPAGTVLRTKPGANEEVPAGTEVQLEVASGRVVVPNVVGRSEQVARADLEKLRFSVLVQRQPNPDVPAGEVIDQNPAPNTKAPRGSDVTIVVASEPEPSPSPTEEPTPTETPSSTPSPILEMPAARPDEEDGETQPQPAPTP